MPGVSITIDQRQVDHVNKLLSSVPEKAVTVYRRAFDRGLQAARTQAAREIRQRYAIQNKDLRTYQTIRSKVDVSSDGVVGYINFSGAKIPLYRFTPRPKERKYTNRYVNGVAGWRITTDVSASDVKGQMIRRRTAFIATFQSGHRGIFARTGRKTETGKDELREFYSFSVADMLDYEPAREAIEQRAAEIVQNRIDHELIRALNETG